MDDDPETLHHSDLVIDTIRENPAGRDARHLDEEYVALRNEGDESIHLGGWTVENEAGETYRFPDDATVGAGERVTLHSGSGTDAVADYYWGSDRPVWHNAGDTVRVRDADGVLRARESYNE